MEDIKSISYFGVIPKGFFWNKFQKHTTCEHHVTGTARHPIGKKLFINLNNDFIVIECSLEDETPFGLRKPTEEELSIWAMVGFGDLNATDFFLLQDAKINFSFGGIPALHGQGTFKNIL